MDGRYRVVRDCFVGKVGDMIKVEDGMDGYNWFNYNTRQIGCPFIEFDCVEIVKPSPMVCPKFGQCRATKKCPLPSITELGDGKQATPTIPAGCKCARFPGGVN